MSTLDTRAGALRDHVMQSRFARWPGILVPLGALLVILLALVFAPSGAEEVRAEGSAAPVEVIELVPTSGFAASTTYVGRVEARRRSDVGFELGGQLAAVRVDEGQAFARGQTLALLDTARLRAARRQLVAQQASARAEAQAARARAERSEALAQVSPDAISAQALDEARFAARAANAQVSAIRAQIAALDVDIRRARITAPFAGVVDARLMDEGQIAAPGAPVLTILETTAPEARIGIPANRDADLSPGQSVTIGVAGQPVSARVRSIGAARSGATRTVDLIATLSARLGSVKDGDLAELTVERNVPGEGFWVPLTALSESRRGLWSVFVAEQDEGQDTPVLVRKEVELVGQDQTRAFVRGAVQAGDLVVASGLQRLAPGAPVSITQRRKAVP